MTTKAYYFDMDGVLALTTSTWTVSSQTSTKPTL